ncbi:tetratricopeptide repeat protein [Scytonema sp. PRP1]|uniref:tetratricopeptide repeat protein n=1 Tax=Scytonema sp. PRP1 TaxID=3120513 RepID=UPI002FCED97E
MKLEEFASLEEALNHLRKKRDFFELEKTKTADYNQKFSLQCDIDECNKEINRLEAEISERQKKANNLTSLPFQIPFILPQKDVSSFTGRDEELQQLQELLIDRQGTKLCSIAGLAGTGGIGKSALACHFATLHKADFPDGVIGLRVDSKDADTIARDFARRCGEEVEPEDERDAKSIMQDVFAHRRILLIFDNAEDANIIKELYPDGNRCAVIITTRDRLLSISLDIPDQGRIEVKPLSKAESLLLLQKLLGEKRIAAEPQISEEIIELAGYLPLALQIIGAALKLNPNRRLADYAASLREERRLARLRIAKDEHLDVRACFSLSLKELQPEQIDFFSCLSVCAEDGFSRRSATATGNYSDELTAQDDLDCLCRFSLLNYAEVGENRFVFHPLIRAFAQELAVERGLRHDAATRHAQFFINLVKSSDVGFINSAIAEDINGIILVADWLQHQESADYEFASQLQEFFEKYGYWKQAVAFMFRFQLLAERFENWELVVKFRIQQAKYLSLEKEHLNAEVVLAPISGILQKIKIEQIRHRSHANWLTTLGGIQRRQHKLDQAVDSFKQALAIQEILDEPDGLSIVLNSLGIALQQQNKLDEAVDVFRRQIEISQQLDDKRQEARGLNCLGGVLQQQNKLDEAADKFRRRVETSQQLDDKRSQAIGLNCLGGVLQQQNKLDEAVDVFRRQIEISQQLDDKRSQAIGLNGLGGVLQQQNKLDEAVDIFRRQIEINQQLDDKHSEAIGLNGLGRVLQQQNKLDEAVNAFRRRIEISQQLNDKRSEAISLNCLGGVLQQQNKLDEAADKFRRQIEISQQLDDKHSEAIGLNGLGGVLQQQNKLDEAADKFRDQIKINQQLHDKHSEAIGLNCLARILELQCQWEEAEEILKRSQDICVDLDDLKSLSIALTTLSRVLRNQQKWNEAEKILRQCYDLSTKQQDQRGQAIILNSLGRVLHKQGGEKKHKLALMYFQESIKLGEQLGDQEHLAKVYTAMGQILLAYGNLEEAVIQLIKGFEIDENLKNETGLTIVTSDLSRALLKLGRVDEARMYCKKALAIAPNHPTLLNLAQDLTPSPRQNTKPILKQGIAKSVKPYKKDS